MIDRFFDKPHVRKRLRVGPLASVVDGYLVRMETLGYSKLTIQIYVQALEHFAGWFATPSRKVDDADAASVNRFLSRHLPHCRCSLPCSRSPHTLRAALYQLLDVLGEARREPPQKVLLPSHASAIADFERYLVDVRGVAPATRRYHVREAQALLAMKFGNREAVLTALRPKDMRVFVESRAHSLSPRSTNVIATAIRSFIGYLRLRGIANNTWLAAIPRSANWRLAHLPRGLTDDEVGAFLRSFDRKTARGRRDYAMALCFLQLGLRASEVAALTVDDVDWRARIVAIPPGKTRRGATLPLPNSVARALADYLRNGRPKTSDRALFVRLRPPRGQCVDPSAARSAVRQAYERAGMDPRLTGTHVLRHTAATRMLRAGVSMKEIADVLGHRSIDTSAIYAKVDLEALAAVALPWIEVRP